MVLLVLALAAVAVIAVGILFPSTINYVIYVSSGRVGIPTAGASPANVSAALRISDVNVSVIQEYLRS